MAKKVKVIYRVTVSHNTCEPLVDGCFLELDRDSFYFRRLVDARKYCKFLKDLTNIRVKLVRIDEYGTTDL